MSSLQKIRDKRADLARQRAALDRQDADLAIAEKVLASLEGAGVPPPPFPAPASACAPEVASLKISHGPTRRDLVIEALSGEKIWMSSAEINKTIAVNHGAPMKTNSLYPMLTNLKKERVIKRDGDKMALTSRINGESKV